MARSLRSGRKIASLSPPDKRSAKISSKAPKATKALAGKRRHPKEESSESEEEEELESGSSSEQSGSSDDDEEEKVAPATTKRSNATPKKNIGNKNISESGSSSEESGSESESGSSGDDEEEKVAPAPTPPKKSKANPKRGLAKTEDSQVEKSTNPPKKEESSSEEDSNSNSSGGEEQDCSSSSSGDKSGDDKLRGAAPAPLKKANAPGKTEDSSSSSDGSDDDDKVKKIAPSLRKKAKTSVKKEDGSSGSDGSDSDDEANKIATAPLKTANNHVNKEESSSSSDGSNTDDDSDDDSDDEVKKIAPAPVKKSNTTAKEEVSCSSSDESDDDELKKVAPAPLKKSASAKEDESSDDGEEDGDSDDDSSSDSEDENNNKTGFTDDNSNWLKPKQTKKMKLMSSSDEEGDDDEIDAEVSSDDEMLEVERQSRLIDAEMQLEQEEAASELRRTIAQQTAVYHLPTAEELEEDENRVVPPSELRARIDDVLEVLVAFKDRREPGRSRSEYVERLGQDMAELFGYLQELVDYFLSMFGPNECFEFLEASDRSRPLVIRVNTLKARRKDLAAALMKRGVRLDPLAPWSKVGLKIHESTVPVGATPEYLAGHYMLQSAASMCPVMALGVKPGDRVLDMSAAPGGKTSYISQLMRNKGVVIANDLKAERQKATVANLHRLGVRNAITCCYDGRKIGVQMRNSFDRILLDAPCSGLGVISRDPSVKVQRTMPDVRRCAHLQKELLVAAIDALNHKSKKGGGYMVYSTCSVAVAENEEVVNYLLSKRDVKLVDTGLGFGKPGFTRFEHKRFHPSVAFTRRFYPHVHNMDGFYVAKIQKLSDKRKGVDEKDKQQTEKSSDAVKVDDATELEKAGEKEKDDAEGGSPKQLGGKKKKGKKKRGKTTADGGNDDNEQARKKSKKISYAPTMQRAQVQKKKKTNAKVTKPRRMKITGM